MGEEAGRLLSHIILEILPTPGELVGKE